MWDWILIIRITVYKAETLELELLYVTHHCVKLQQLHADGRMTQQPAEFMGLAIKDEKKKWKSAEESFPQSLQKSLRSEAGSLTIP